MAPSQPHQVDKYLEADVKLCHCAIVLNVLCGAIVLLTRSAPAVLLLPLGSKLVALDQVWHRYCIVFSFIQCFCLHKNALF